MYNYFLCKNLPEKNVHKTYICISVWVYLLVQKTSNPPPQKKKLIFSPSHNMPIFTPHVPFLPFKLNIPAMIPLSSLFSNEAGRYLHVYTPGGEEDTFHYAHPCILMYILELTVCPVLQRGHNKCHYGGGFPQEGESLRLSPLSHTLQPDTTAISRQLSFKLQPASEKRNF
jgi:hypothetical protein